MADIVERLLDENLTVNGRAMDINHLLRLHKEAADEIQALRQQLECIQNQLYRKVGHEDGLDLYQTYQDACDVAEQQLADLTGVVCGECVNGKIENDDVITGDILIASCPTCKGTGRIKTHAIVPIEPTEEMIDAAMEVEGMKEINACVSIAAIHGCVIKETTKLNSPLAQSYKAMIAAGGKP